MMTGEQVLAHSHDYRLVVLSVLISILAAYAARALIDRLRDAHGRAWLAWLAGGATVDGIGIWSMHYTAMLAFRLPIPFWFDWPTVLLSLIAGILGSGLTIALVSRGRIGWRRALASSIALGAIGISGLHYTAMAAMQLMAEQHYNAALVILSVVLGIAFAFSAITLYFLIDPSTPGRGLRTHVATMLRGLANPVMHYTAMAAVIFTATNAAPDFSHAVSIDTIGVLGISIVPIMMLVVALLTTLAGRLQQQREMLQTIFDHIPVMIRFLDADGRVKLVNRAYERTLGWKLQELQHPDMNLFRELYPNEQERQRALDFIAGATGEWGDFTFRTRTGKEIHTTWANIRLADGTAIGIGQDITDRKQAEAALRAAQERTESILSSVTDTHILFDRQWRYLYVNDAAARAIGRPSEQILGRSLWELYPDIVGTALEYHYRRAMDEHVHVVFDFHYTSNDTWWENRFYPAPEGLAVFASDITARKRAEGERARLFEQLQLLSRQLLQAQEAERRSIARELHDEIGQQLTGISLMLSSSLQDASALNLPELTSIRAQVRDLIGRLRNISLDLRPTILDDLGLLPALIWLFERYTSQTNVSVRFEHLGVEGQRFQVEVETTAYRIVQEALTNGARHAGVSEVVVRLWVDEDTLWVVITDQGRGFDRQRIDTRVSSGLAGMQERVALLGGELTIESVEGRGTQLTAALPLNGDGGMHQ